MRLLALPLAVLAVTAYHVSSHTLSAKVRSEVISSGNWHHGCPVPLSQLRLLTFRYWGFDRHVHTGQIVVNETAVKPLAKVFRRLYAMRFPIRDARLASTYGTARVRPKIDDVTASFECRQAVPSPCTGGTGTGSWSEHAYGEAVDLDPRENPYVGCGMTRDKAALSYLDRSRLRRGMVTPAVVATFASVGWGWGGSWSGSTKDYMHFSATGH